MSEYSVYARDGLFDSLLYGKLAELEKNPQNKEIFRELSKQEYVHYEFWSKFTGRFEPTSYEKLKLSFYLFLSRILGKTFIIKFLERHETSVVEEYTRLLKSTPFSEEDKKTLEK